MARSPLKATAAGTTVGLAGVGEVWVTPTRGCSGFSFLGHPVRQTETTNNESIGALLVRRSRQLDGFVCMFDIKRKLHRMRVKRQNRRTSNVKQTVSLLPGGPAQTWTARN